MKDFVLNKLGEVYERDDKDTPEDAIQYYWFQDEGYNEILKGFLGQWELPYNKLYLIGEYLDAVNSYIESADLPYIIPDRLIEITVELILKYLENIGRYND